MEIKPSTFLVSMIMFTLIISLGLALIAGFASQYSSSYTDNDKYYNFSYTFGQQQAINGSIVTLQNVISQKNTPNALEAANALFGLGVNGLLAFANSLGFLVTIITGLSTIFGLPAIVVWAILGVITVGVTFAIISAIFYKEL